MFSLLKLAVLASLAAVAALASAPDGSSSIQADAAGSPAAVIDVSNGGGGWLDTTTLPNGRVRWEAMDAAGNIVETGYLLVENSALTQVVSTFDIYTIRNVYDNALITELYEDQSTFVISYREIDVATDTITVLRAATPDEAALYWQNRASLVQEQGKADAIAGLQADPEQGASYLEFVNTNVPLLQACQADMATAQGFDFNALGPNTQNDAIRRMQECSALEAKIDWKTLSNLYQLLVANGWIPVAE
jgi:hypothetical protein